MYLDEGGCRVLGVELRCIALYTNGARVPLFFGINFSVDMIFLIGVVSRWRMMMMSCLCV